MKKKNKLELKEIKNTKEFIPRERKKDDEKIQPPTKILKKSNPEK